ncbi:hypothetical protein [Roseivirga misakiensis]|uniref:Gliding motility protein GldN n=1 Tax=Roseivirga misakiensis TaxID=1563681 RepID=A0A1E5T665_9BACT|nr:hypothetical protein [Roseivirga misakiensis]OEK06871.1 hypothetical protein BFP71_04235 [Roseivirga misakiensis]
MWRKLSCLLLLVLSISVVAQEEGTGVDPAKFLRTLESTTKVAGLNSARKIHNDFSVRPIRDEDVMFSIRLWSKLNFSEKMNQPWNAKDSRITQLLVDGINEFYNAKNEALDQVSGITPYLTLEDGSTGFEEEDIMLQEDFNQAMSDYSTQQGNYDESLRSRDRTALKLRDGGIYENYTSARLDSIIDLEYSARSAAKALDPAIKGNLNVLLIEEDLIFDRNESVAKWDIVSISLISPSTASVDGTEREIVRVKYQDFANYVEKVFAESNKNKAYWYNPRNPRNKEINFSHAFDLRLFSSYITKFQNPDDSNIQTLYGKADYDYSIIELARKKRNELLEKMHNLWEY